MKDDAFLKDGKIDISKEGVNYWANKIKCEPADLSNAINKVGDNYKLLILFLELNRKINR